MPRRTEAQARLAARRRWFEIRRTEALYARQLRSVADVVERLVRGMAPDGIVKDPMSLRNVLNNYSAAIAPWARVVSQRMHAEIMRRDETAWRETSASLGKELRRELNTATTGEAVHRYLNEQVGLITSLPSKAAQRVHHLALESMVNAGRAREVAEEILKTGLVTRGRANLIARTEVARTASLVTQSRAEHVGSPGYIWRSVGDSDVRPALNSKHFAAMNTFERGSHRKLSGTFHAWNDPPISGSRGERAHAGAIYNCRCWPEPVLDENKLRDLVASGEVKIAGKALSLIQGAA